MVTASAQLEARDGSTSSSSPSLALSPRSDHTLTGYVHVETPVVQQDATSATPTTTYDLHVDPHQFDRATHIKPLSFLRPHMRTFHVSWLTAIPGFLGWYAIPPLMPVIKDQLGLSKGDVLNSDIASTASTIISRIAVGPLLELYGPQVVHSLTLWLGAIPIICAAFVSSSTSLILVRFFIGLVGCIFVSSQFWTTITFAKNVVGTSNAITGGLGLSGIGMAFLILPLVNAGLASAMSDDLAWRVTIALPAFVMIVMGSIAWYRADGCPMGPYKHLRLAQLERDNGHVSSAESGGLRAVLARLGQSFKIVLSDWNTHILILHYAVCFGAELQLNNMGALYFFEEFDAATCTTPTANGRCPALSKQHAALLASTFGLMNMWARALGGLSSDFANRKWGMRGRLVVQFVLLCLEGGLIMALSRSTALGSSVVLYIVVAVAAQSAGGSTFGIVPYVNEAYTGTVTGLVGAGGNIGGVVFGIIFRSTATRADGLFIMGCIVLASSVFAACIVIRREKQDAGSRTTVELAHSAAMSDEASTTASTAVADGDVPPTPQKEIVKSAMLEHTRGPSRAGAQVAPLPAIDAFHVGQMLRDPSQQPPAPTREDEESYIPVALAKAHLARVVQDMHAMKEEQTAKMTEILTRYRTIEAETKDFYEKQIAGLKAKASAKFLREQQRHKDVEDASRVREDGLRDEMRQLEDAHEQERERQQYERERWREDVASALLWQEEQLTRLQIRATQEIERVRREHRDQLRDARRALENELRMACEDVSSSSLRMVSHLEDLAREADAQEKRYRREWRALETRLTADRDVALCVADIVSRVVENEQLSAYRLRSSALQAQIERLAHEVNASRERESALSEQLSRARVTHERRERKAVAETLELMVRTVEMTPLPPTPKMPLTSDQQTLAALRVESSDVDVQAAAETSDASTATDVASPSPTPPEEEKEGALLSTASSEQLQFEADVERFRARNAELVRSKQLLREAKSEMQRALEAKNAAKAQIKTWLAEFQAQHGRDPTIEEKAVVKEMYLAFKDCEERYNASKERVATLKVQHHSKVVEVDALSQWHALATRNTSSRGSSREDHVSARSRGVEDEVEQEASVEGSRAKSMARVDELEQELASLREALRLAREEAAKAELSRAMTMETAAAKDEHKETKTLEASVIETAHAPAKKGEHQLKAEEKRPRSGPDETKKRIQSEKHEREAERLAQLSTETLAMSHQRDELQSTITQLVTEIASRHEEKAKLEREIEQLRLHLELSEAGGLDSPVRRREALDDMDTEGGQEEEEEEEEEKESDAAEIGEEELSAVADPKDETLSDDERRDDAQDAQLVALIKDAIEAGKAQWNRGDKAKCFQVYVRTCEKAIEILKLMKAAARREEVALLRTALQEGGRLPPAKGSMTLRRALDTLLTSCEKLRSERAAKSAPASPSKSVASPSKSTASPTKKKQAVDTELSATAPASGKALEEYKQKLKALEAKAKADRVKITQLEAALTRAETQAAASASAGASGGSNTVVLERKIAELEKKHAKALDEAERVMKRDVQALTTQLSTSQGRCQSLQEQLDKVQKELTTVGGRASQLSKLEEEVVALRATATQVETLQRELTTTQASMAQLEGLYKEEQTLRKKYYNQIEDMKGKIRVYARCRPMSQSETERGCAPCVRFLDEFSLELKTSHGPKTFAYDQVFTPASTQEQVFEDTKNLLQSALDGYNVCIFAYGQTGSGKTFTMTGSEALPGLSPRAIHHLFRLADECKANHTITFSAFMLELYNDTLVDLLHLVDGGSDKDAPKLEIKKNERGLVVVQNITVKPCTSAAQTLRLFELANRRRQVGATRMNAESSRSHSVFSVLVENLNHTTRATSIGKLSLVDLAGSERAGKTGATAERLKEAQAINKSLSALGDVISALSNNEKFIPYRNNKLTQLMQDSLGGNAKTLMFVNISPADYNQEETQTSLQYASRVKLITNNANKSAESEQVNKLKAIIRQLRSGKTDVDLDGVLD
ncbi:hypothetical protein P43SY_001556 [Pythium insidiosum]|uniref:Kinesin motor domain-containing protein n=1 Tax=Pythium insidiosum TaxID=114742 RepID=A0AAD5QC13_PYTIN|nr:hypothetical protein P43SY_001556 [Pythium insidiosum]